MYVHLRDGIRRAEVATDPDVGTGVRAARSAQRPGGRSHGGGDAGAPGHGVRPPGRASPRGGPLRGHHPGPGLRVLRHLAAAGGGARGHRVAADRHRTRSALRGGYGRLPQRGRTPRADGGRRAPGARGRPARVPGQLPVPLRPGGIHGCGGDHHRVQSGQTPPWNLDPPEGRLRRHGGRGGVGRRRHQHRDVAPRDRRARHPAGHEEVRSPDPRRPRRDGGLDRRGAALRPPGRGGCRRGRHPRLAAGVRSA